MDLRVSVTGGVHFDLVKRVLRDIQRAGQEPEEIIHQISETVACPFELESISAFSLCFLASVKGHYRKTHQRFTGFIIKIYSIFCGLTRWKMVFSGLSNVQGFH